MGGSGTVVERLNDSLENAVHRTRRSRFLRRLVIPIVLAVLVLAVVLVGRERVARQDYETSMAKMYAMIVEYRASHDEYYPSQDELALFELNARSLMVFDLHYNGDRILNESPAETILLYTPYLDLRLYSSGHAVLYLDGHTEWLGRTLLEQKLLEDKQFYNRMVLQ